MHEAYNCKNELSRISFKLSQIESRVQNIQSAEAEAILEITREVKKLCSLLDNLCNGLQRLKL